jgi:hypothetical protein
MPAHTLLQGRVPSHPDVDGQGSDPLEEKYLNLYEQKLSPFQLVRIVVVIIILMDKQ